MYISCGTYDEKLCFKTRTVMDFCEYFLKLAQVMLHIQEGVMSNPWHCYIRKLVLEKTWFFMIHGPNAMHIRRLSKMHRILKL